MSVGRKSPLNHHAVLGDPTVGPIRRVTGIQDKEGKTRMVAILDYWSQAALLPLHDRLFRILRSIPQDMTYSQGEFYKRVEEWTAGDNPVRLYSVDLTKATDRFPIRFISFVLKGILSDRFVSHWENIMVGYPFTTKSSGDVVYRAGNPMGAYSS